MFEASRWHTDERFLAPMMILGNGEQIFVGDIVTFQDPSSWTVLWESDEVYYYYYYCDTHQQEVQEGEGSSKLQN